MHPVVELAQHSQMVLVFHGPEQQNDAPRIGELLEIGAERAARRRVVGGVEEKRRAAAVPFEPARPLRLPQSPTHALLRNLEASAAKLVEHRQGTGRVVGLVSAAQPHRKAVEASVTDFGVELSIDPPCREIAVDPTHGSSDRLGTTRERPAHARMTSTDDARDPGLEHARFFARDLRQRVAENVGVLEADRGDHRHFGNHDVRRIESTPKPHLEKDDVTGMVAKRLEREERGVLEESELPQTRVGPQLLQATGRLALADRPAADPDPLDVTLEVRRGELARAVARRAKHRLEHGGDAPLAIGTGDVHETTRALRVAPRLSRCDHPFQAELDPARLQPVKPAQLAFVGLHRERYSTRRATLPRISWRVEMMSIIPCSRRNSAR